MALAGSEQTRLDDVLPLAAGALAAYPGPILVVDRDGRVVAQNEPAERLRAAYETRETEAIANLIRAARDGRAHQETILLKGEKGPLTYELSALPLADGKGAMLIGRDLSLERNLRAALVDSRQRYKDLVEISADFAWETGPDGRFVFVSPKGVLGHRADQMVGADPADFFFERVENRANSPFHADEPATDSEVWMRDSKGRPACLRISAIPLKGPEGEWMGARGVGQDITDWRAKAADLARANNRERILTYITRTIRDEIDLSRMLGAAAAAIARAVSAGGCQIFRADDQKGFLVAAQFGTVGIEDQAMPILAQFEGGKETVEANFHPWQVLGAVTRYHHGVNGALLLWRDIDRPAWSEEERSLVIDIANQVAIANEHLANHERIVTVSRTDPLTGLFNRRAFFEELGRRHARLERDGRPGALIYVDLDNFKLVNDKFGHQRGDEALQAVKALLVGGTRPTDLLARLGGDEFAIWLDGADEAIAVARAKALLESGRTLHHFSGSADKPMHFSLGVAVYVPGSGEPLEHMLARADAAMYRVKHTSKGSYCVAPHGTGAATKES